MLRAVSNTSNAIFLSLAGSVSNVGGEFEGRKFSQLPTSDAPLRRQDMIDSIASKFCSVAKFIGTIAGALTAAIFSIATCGMGLAIWNSMNDERNDLFSVFMNRGGDIGHAIARFITCSRN